MTTLRKGLYRSAALVVPLLLSAAGMTLVSAQAQEAGQDGSYTRTDTGVIVEPGGGPVTQVRLEIIADDIIHVIATPDETELPESLIAVARPDASIPFDLSESDGAITLSTEAASARVMLSSGRIDFMNADGEIVLSEVDRGAFNPIDLDGETLFEVRQEFNRDTDEGFYGLGQHQNHQYNLNGEDVELAQHNVSIANPFIVSSNNYGVLWDNYSITKIGDPRDYQPITGSLTVRDADGREGGLTATYYLNEEVLLTQQEADIDYQYLPADQYVRGNAERDPYPAEVHERLGDDTADPTLVTWEGTIETDESGVHKFRLYGSSYMKVYVDGELVLDRWRQNWNPWYHNFTLDMAAGEARDIRVEWQPVGGYLRLLHLDPQPEEERNQLSFASEAGHAINYYFVSGDDLDEVISGYREVTGKAVMLPKWAYGFWQSRERYKTQDELVEALSEYRDRNIPIDNIVLDWNYWPEDAWGSHAFDEARFPDPQGMVDAVHEMDAQIMISVWPKFYPTTDNYKELDEAGAIYRRQIEMQSLDWIGTGYLNSFYDPYSDEAREIFWRQMEESLATYGFDAWWMDATEPDTHSNLSIEERKLRASPTALGSMTEYFNTYALENARAVYEGERDFAPDDRTFILTRSGFAGIQRYGAAIWSGDVVSRWDDLRDQIYAGIGVGLSGIPNWTHDIGGFSVEDRYASEDPAHLEEWRELNLRWFQFGAFSPIFRSHGQYPFREIYNISPEGHPVYDAMVWYDELRYQLMPYIYTAAADMYHQDYTLMRGLVMDFPEDETARNRGDEYMFGSAFLVAPVYEFKSRYRDVYLPAGTDWYDFATGEKHEGGQTLRANAPLARMPLFVRAGSIIPTGPVIQHTGQDTGGALTVTVYTGADGAFSLYEDDGETYDYDNGEFARIPMSWDDAAGELTIGKVEGAYPGMPKSRKIAVRIIDGPIEDAADFEENITRTVTYKGREITVSR